MKVIFARSDLIGKGYSDRHPTLLHKPTVACLPLHLCRCQLRTARLTQELTYSGIRGRLLLLPTSDCSLSSSFRSFEILEYLLQVF
ncbi:hypothetical protein L1887_24099 [Cichorium endivia]|nr:hypothetical protein L1887_24099 [Cichorium endivia]